MLPNNRLSSVAVSAAFDYPSNIPRVDKTVDYELGGVALFNPSLGLQVQAWRARVVGNDLVVGPFPSGAETVILTAPGTTEITLGFDQNMNPALAYVQAGVAKLYWFDTLVSAYVISTFPGARSPFCTLDDNRPSQVGNSDVVLFYLVGGGLYFRQQRERFTVERLIASGLSGSAEIEQVGMTANLRLKVLVS